MPIRPMNIRRMMTLLPIVLKSGVMPIDKPVVPKAEHTSNSSSSKECFSVTVKMSVETKTRITAISVTINDFIKSAWCSSLLKTFTDLFPLAKWNRANRFKAKVVVRMPPPTELGEAPINISIHINKMVVCVNWLISIVASPPLLVVVD